MRTIDFTDAECSFLRGYDYARIIGRQMTNREIENAFPEVIVDAFSSGISDYLAKDNYRFNLITKGD